MNNDLRLSIPKPSPDAEKQWLQKVKKQIDTVHPWEAVKEFHEVMGQPVGSEPHLLDEERLAFRLSLITEEWDELYESLSSGDLVNAFKEMADMVYVIEGLAVEMGGDLDRVFAEVHRSNMTKVGKDGKVIFREDGKVLKPETYEVADIQGVLF